MKANPPASELLNYGGLVCVIIGGILFSRVRSETGASEKEVVTLSSIKRTSKDNVNGAETALLTHDETLAEKESREIARSKHDGKQRAIRNRPLVPSFIVLPSLLAGLLWAIAQSSFFVANQHLSQAVTFPIIAMLPGCIASAWSIIYFHEIKGSRNFKILAVAMLVTFSGAAMVGLSKFVNL
ncbi:hypothetical protein TELCIR_08462 [Teladorsagia circumcincta]|uniref:Uncharacterized protein n=1 Tax=Teladorsagia circumcincta TaxID=45464 RepID=A0A2G9UHI4_TELCI|nr:hypothetical protein TELCIR_08462 [Teladorsagia circumcincta]